MKRRLWVRRNTRAQAYTWTAVGLDVTDEGWAPIEGKQAHGDTAQAAHDAFHERHSGWTYVPVIWD